MASRWNAPATFKRPMKPGSHRGLQQALSALYGPHSDMTPDEMLAERERVRVEVEAKHRVQGELHLAPKASE